VSIGIAYGTEKRQWLEAVVEAWRASPAGRDISIDLIPLGSSEGAKAILSGDKRINVWAPASSISEQSFSQDFELKYGHKPIQQKETLALTPFVFVFWKERAQAFVEHYGKVNFATIEKALVEPTGWAEIAKKPEWGLFKFAHTNPQESNSGLICLWLMAQEAKASNVPVTVADIVAPSFLKMLRSFENSLSAMPNSTGNMMREMVLKGPGSFDAVAVYENVAIDFIHSAEGRWGSISVVYPALNTWNDNPYYILNVPWSSPDQTKAARAFLDFVMGEPMQRLALAHGFRPGNTSVPVIFPESPFQQYAAAGLRIDPGNVIPLPSEDVVRNLLAAWQREVRSR
jgi:ABC-type Fe3+ transport system substrate-binding protein